MLLERLAELAKPLDLGKDQENIESTISRIKEESLSPYCLNECQTTCCDFTKKIYLTLSDEELFSLFPGKEKEEMNEEGLLDFNKYGKNVLKNTVCPYHDQETSLCSIHDKPYLPQDCRDFPLVKTRRYGIVMEARCPYIRENWEDIVLELENKHQKELSRMNPRFTMWILDKTDVRPYDVDKDYTSIKERL